MSECRDRSARRVQACDERERGGMGCPTPTRGTVPARPSPPEVPFAVLQEPDPGTALNVTGCRLDAQSLRRFLDPGGAV